MSVQDNTFIDAYGLELSDELESSYADPVHHERGSVHEPPQLDAAQREPRSYRFDAASRHRTLRGPHFKTSQAASSTSGAPGGWDAFDTNVIDVGAAWASSASTLQAAIDETRAAVPHQVDRAIEAAETEEASDQVVDVVTTDVMPAETVAARAEQVTSPDPPDAEQKASVAADCTTPSEPPVRFSPVWEVDRFHWPDAIEQLFKTQTEYFDYAGKKLVAASREGLKILGVMSSRAGEGSTTLAMCLARAAAGAGAKVGLLDGNLVRSELGEQLGVDFASGWQSAAVSEQPLAEAAITGIEERITLFPSTTEAVAEIESLADTRVGQVLRAAAGNCDLLVLDLGQADLGDNVGLLDAAIVVRDIRHTSRDETLRLATALRDCGVNAVGIAENFSTSNPQRAAA